MYGRGSRVKIIKHQNWFSNVFSTRWLCYLDNTFGALCSRAENELIVKHSHPFWIMDVCCFLSSLVFSSLLTTNLILCCRAISLLFGQHVWSDLLTCREQVLRGTFAAYPGDECCVLCSIFIYRLVFPTQL